MKVFSSLFVVFLVGILLGPSLHAGVLDPQLAANIAQTSSDELMPVWIEVRTEDKGDFRKFVAESATTRAEQHSLALTELRRRSQNQERLLGAIDILKARGRTGRVKGHWIANVIEAEISAGELAALATHDDVIAIYPAPEISLIEPTAQSEIELTPDSTASNIRHVRAPEAWAAGYTGAGRLICSFDTGVNGLHPALYSRWKGLDGDSAAAWFDPVGQQPFPHYFPEYGGVVPSHGTHTMGIMVGADPATFDTVGVAPGAKWISAAVIDIPGASILDAFEWAADPDGNPNTVSDVPDVINHSWGYQDLGCLNIFYTAIENTEALGIVNIFAVGNDGIDGPRTPANRALDSLDCFSVGNLIHATDVIASNSSRGPSPCDLISIKPNVIAPGTNIRSCWYNLTTRYSTLSGTSQAAPHVSGLVALLRQKNPNATVAQIKTAILTSTRRIAAWGGMPNYTYGWGEINCVAALAILSSANPTPNLRVYDFDHAPITAGNTVSGAVLLQNLGATVTSVAARVLATNSALTILDGNLSFGTISANQVKRSTDSIRITVADTVTDGTILSADFVITGSSYTDTTRLHFIVGDPPSKTLATHTGSRIQFTLSNYGVYGFATGSMFPLHGSGFTFDGLSNDLWEGGLMVGTSYSKVSSGVHSYLFDPDMDFKPAPSGDIQLIDPGPVAAQQTWAMFDDSRAAKPLGVLVTQESFLHAAPNDDFLILRYILKNTSATTMSNLHVGLFMDWDIPTNYLYNAGGYEADGAFLWQAYNSGTVLSRFRGMKLLEGQQSAAGAFDFDVYFHWPPGGGSVLADGLSTDEKFNAMTSGLLYADANKTSREDIFSLVAAGPITLVPNQLDTVVFALLAAGTVEDMRAVALRADSILTDVDDPDDINLLPHDFVLHQNYPNPFNPSTVITFDLPRRCRYHFEVINVLGQTIYEVETEARPGRQEIAWSGEGYASGAYFYRLTVDGRSIARKMMLLK